MSGYIMDLRKIVGHRPLLQVGASVILEDKQGRVLLQKRTDNHCWGYPGGSTDLDERVEDAAARELFEETGYGNGTWKMNMKMSTNPSTNANWTYNFIAEDVELLDSKQHLDGGECLTVHLLTLDEIKRLLKENGIIQSLHACALWKYIAENHLL